MRRPGTVMPWAAHNSREISFNVGAPATNSRTDRRRVRASSRLIAPAADGGGRLDTFGGRIHRGRSRRCKHHHDHGQYGKHHLIHPLSCHINASFASLSCQKGAGRGVAAAVRSNSRCCLVTPEWWQDRPALPEIKYGFSLPPTRSCVTDSHRVWSVARIFKSAGSHPVD